MSRRRAWWLAAALVLIASGLRLPLASVGPVLDDIRAAVGLSSAGAGALTTLPLLCFAGAGAAVPALARRVGTESALLLGVLVLAAGIALRAFPQLVPLFAGTLLIGGGIAVANVLVPVLIKREYARPGAMMGVYTAVMTAGAAIGAGLTVPLADGLGSWQAALAVWALLPLVAAASWLPAVRHARSEPSQPPAPPVRLRGDRLAWLLTGVFACQSTLFYATVTWMPDLLQDGGMSHARAGAMLAIAMLLGIPSGLLAPVLAGRMRDQRAILAGAVALWVVGLSGLLVAPIGPAPLWMVVLGLAQGASFSLAMTLVVLRAPDQERATALSGMVQAVGYLLAAAGPLALGALHDATGGWDAVLVAMLVLAAGMLACGLGAARPGTVRGCVSGAPQRAY